MTNILLILVGGTICTSLNAAGNLSVSKEAGLLLKENYLKSDSPYAGSVTITQTKNLYILSENMTVEKWNTIISVYRKYMENQSYDGIIIAHGTDTLAYSAALFSMLLSATKIPVFFVSANENLKSERTNGNDNFRCAVECICRKIPANVYVPYKNLSDGKMFLHLASRLKQCENYTEDFHSVGEFDVSAMTEENYKEYFVRLENMYPKKEKKQAIDFFGDWKLKDCILYLTPYVGINYAAYKYQSFSAVLHGAFHSGTACAGIIEHSREYDQYSILYLLDQCFGTGNNIDVFFAPSELKSGTYETVSIIGNHEVNGKRVHFLNGYTYEMAYAKLLIAYSLFENEKDRQDFIYGEYNFEEIH